MRAGYASAGHRRSPAPTPAQPSDFGHDEGVVTQSLLLWLVLYAASLAVIGFVLLVGRGITGRPRSNVALLRTASTAAFVLAMVVWVLILLSDG
jgi:hypothetical protein